MASVNEPAQPISPKDEHDVITSRYKSLFSDQTSPVVSEHLRSSVERDDVIFDPILVSIGPFHHGKFPDMEEHKRRILKSILIRLTTRRDTSINIDLLTWLDDAMKGLEEKTRSFYSGAYDPEIDFPRMMVYDGCFILQMFLMISSGPIANVDPIFKEEIMMAAIVKDMVKLYNQLPYFVLEKLYEKTRITNEPLISLAGSFIDRLTAGLNTLWIHDDPSPDHLLGLFHMKHLNIIDRRLPIDDTGKINSLPPVTDLCLSGIKVVGKKPGKNLRSLLDIGFSNGRLEIPTLYVGIYTEILMRNVLVYEQSNPHSVPDVFTSYVTFMDALVNSIEDVEMLRVAGVINHSMNSNEEVSRILNSLTTNIPVDMKKGYLADINGKIYRHHCSRWERFKACVKRLVSSREGIAFIIIVAVLYFTILQTVLAVLAYVHPKPSSVTNPLQQMIQLSRIEQTSPFVLPLTS